METKLHVIRANLLQWNILEYPDLEVRCGSFCVSILESNSNTPIPILKLHALHKQYTDYPTLASEYEEESLYKNYSFLLEIYSKTLLF